MQEIICGFCGKKEWIAVCLNCGKYTCNEHTGNSVNGPDYCGFLCSICSVSENTYIISYKLFGEWHEDTKEWDVQDGTAVVQAASRNEAISKVQETIGLYVIECVQK